MFELQVFLHPGDEMIFEGTFDDLVQQIRRHLMDIGSRECDSEGLNMLRWLVRPEAMKMQ